jgi:ubiquinone/menaquinone biosynthesis C-methylase UbiE
MTTYWDHVQPDSFLQNEIEGYHKPVRQQYRSILSKLEVSTMLEVGCGPGVDYVGAVSTKPSIQYTGVDYTNQLVDYCREKYPTASFLQGDIHSLPFPKSSFGLVYCKDVLNHLDDWVSAFKELHRVSSKYVLVNFFKGLGSTTMKLRIQGEGYIDNYYDWNEVMTNLTAFQPSSLTVYTVTCPPNGEETLILFEKK